MKKSALSISAAALLAFQILLVVTGGLVRLTGSGLGCPTWPKCTADSYRPIESQPQLHAWIEFGNRLLTFALFAAAMTTLYFVYRIHKKGWSDLKLLAWLQVGGILGQGVLGGFTVLTKLNPASVASHLLLSMLLISGATTLHLKSKYSESLSESLLKESKENSTLGDSDKVDKVDKVIAKILATFAFLTLIAGTIVTGSGPHAGDWQAPRFNIAITLAAKYHGALVAITLLITLYIAIKLPRSEANWLLVAIIGQGLIGLIQWWQGLPQALVGAHLLGAALFWFATWRTRLSFKYEYLKTLSSKGQ